MIFSQLCTKGYSIWCKFGVCARIVSVKQTVIYCRVSTDAQNHGAQLAELRSYCADRKWTNVEEIVDTISGSTSSRKGLDRLMSLVRRGKVASVVCYKLDRLGRSLAHLVQVVTELNNHGVALVVPGAGDRHVVVQPGRPISDQHPVRRG